MLLLLWKCSLEAVFLLLHLICHAVVAPLLTSCLDVCPYIPAQQTLQTLLLTGYLSGSVSLDKLLEFMLELHFAEETAATARLRFATTHSKCACANLETCCHPPDYKLLPLHLVPDLHVVAAQGLQ